MEAIMDIFESRENKKHKNKMQNQNHGDEESNINPAQAVTKKTKSDIWDKWTLISCLAARDFVMGFALGEYGSKFYKAYKDDKKKDPPAFAVGVLLMLIVLVMLCDLFHFFMYASKKLKPTVFMVTNLAQAGAWAGVIVLDFVVISDGKGVQNKWWPFICCLVFINPLIYGAYILFTYKKKGKQGHYEEVADQAHVPLNNEAYTQPPTQQMEFTDTSYSSHPRPTESVPMNPPARPEGAAYDYYNTRR